MKPSPLSSRGWFGSPLESRLSGFSRWGDTDPCRGSIGAEIQKPRERSSFARSRRRRGSSFRFDNGSRGKHDLPEIMGGGVALFDADGDGKLDIYLCNGGPINASTGKR